MVDSRLFEAPNPHVSNVVADALGAEMQRAPALADLGRRALVWSFRTVCEVTSVPDADLLESAYRLDGYIPFISVVGSDKSEPPSVVLDPHGMMVQQYMGSLEWRYHERRDRVDDAAALTGLREDIAERYLHLQAASDEKLGISYTELRRHAPFMGAVQLTRVLAVRAHQLLESQRTGVAV